MSENQYIHFRPVGVDGSDGAKSDQELIDEGWWCPICRNPKPETGAIDFQIYQKHPVNSPICNSAFHGVSFARRDFLSLLGDENVSKDLMLGTIYGPSGTPIDGWVTVRGRNRVIVRGHKRAGFEQFVNSRICESCGNRTYSAYPPNYLYPAPNAETRIMQSDLGGLVVPSGLVEHLGLKRKKGFGIEKLKVLSEPKDGLGDLCG